MGRSEKRGKRKSKSKRRSRPGRQMRKMAESLGKRIQDDLGRKVVFTPSKDGVKMSEVLEAFIQPYLEAAPTQEDVRKLMTIASMAWNISLLPEERRAGAIEQALSDMSLQAREKVRFLLDYFIQRKEQNFAEFRRAVLGFEVRETKDGFYLVVASTPENV